MLEPEFSNLKLRHFIEGLRKRGRDDEAEYWKLVVALELGMNHHISESEVLDMDIDDIIVLMQLPPKPEGYNLFAYGRSAIGNRG